MGEPRVLVVDDSEVIVEMLQLVLENEGFAVETAEEGPTALRLLGGPLPDAVLLDVRMPDMDGWQVLARLRAEPRTRQLPVAVMSTEDEEAGWVKALGRGAQAYVRKPFAPSRVTDLLRELAGA
jgi:CheY-like chemotaxis protein